MRSFKFNIKFALLICILCLALAITLVPNFPFEGISYADSSIEAIFPSDGYIQSKSPSLISANDSYLLIFDKDNNSLICRDLSTNIDKEINLTITNVLSISLLDDTAFIETSTNNYSIDLTQNDYSIQEVNLDSSLSFNSFKSNGMNLYAKSISGNLCIYDKSFAKKDSICDDYKYIFAGKNVFAGNDYLSYSFTFNSGIPTLNIYSFENDSIEEHSITEIVQNAYIGLDIFALVDGKIKVLSIEDGSTILSTDIECQSYSVFQNKVYAINNNSINVYEYDNLNCTISLISSISMSGSDNKHLNNPKSIIKTQDSLIVADYDNNRIAYIYEDKTMDYVLLDAKPFMVDEHNGSVYALCNNDTIYKIQDKQITQSYTLNGCTSLTYLDKLYALKNDGIYTLIGGRFVKYYSIDNCLFIDSNDDSNNLYLISISTLYIISKQGKLINSIDYDFSNVNYFKVDYAGNLYLLKDNTIVKINNNLNQLGIDNSYSPSLEIKATFNSFDIDGTNIYLTCDECLILKDNFQTITSSSFIKKEVDLCDEKFSYAKLINANSKAFNEYANPDSIFINSYDIVLLSSKEYNSSYSYAKTSDGIIVVNNSDYELINEDTDNLEYIVNKTSYVYSSLLEPASSTVSQGQTIQAISKITINQTTYIKFENNGIKYININNLEINKPKEENLENNKTYGRIQTKKIGTVVNIYELSDENSNIVLSLSDGKKIEIIEEDGDFYYISYNDSFGYVKKSDVKVDGLTQIQIIAIVLSLIVFVAGTIIFISISIYKKKND